MSALASITAQYTDSENEEDHKDEDSADSHASQVIIPKRKSPTQKRSPDRPQKESIKKKRSKKVRRLVSYQDDTIISDEEESPTEESESETDSEDDKEDGATSEDSENIKKNADDDADEDESAQVAYSQFGSQSPSKLDKYASYKFSLPPEPKGKPAAEVTEKIRQLYDKMKTTNMDMNGIIQRRKEFRNPSIYKKLIEFCDINEFGTNYPPEIYDPLRWGTESYYEELARVQKNEMIKRQKEAKESDKIGQATALARKVEEEAKKRKSKWDQPSKPIAPPTLTTTVTGTKGTVISAFGSLPKKPAA